MATTRIADAKRLVIKVGSALVTNNGEGLDLNAITEWARQIAALRADGPGDSTLHKHEMLIIDRGGNDIRGFQFESESRRLARPDGRWRHQRRL